MKTKVLFLIETDEMPTVFAYFPEEKYNEEGTLNTCYAHIGQHGACSSVYAEQCIVATSEEYSELQNELENIGYDLEILN